MKLYTGWQRCTRPASPPTYLQEIQTISSRITHPSSEKRDRKDGTDGYTRIN